MKNIKIVTKLFKIFFLLLVYNSQVYAFSPLYNDCKVNFQNNIYLLGLRHSGKHRLHNKKNFDLYNWNGKCRNGYAYGKGDLKVTAMRKSLFFNVNGTIKDGNFIGKVYIDFSTSLEKFINSPFKVELWVYKNKIFKSFKNFYRHVEKNDSIYASNLKKDKEIIKEEKLSKNSEANDSESFLGIIPFLIGFLGPIYFVIWLFTPSKPTYVSDDYETTDRSFSRSEKKDYDLEQTIGKIEREKERIRKSRSRRR